MFDIKIRTKTIKQNKTKQNKTTTKLLKNTQRNNDQKLHKKDMFQHFIGEFALIKPYWLTGVKRIRLLTLSENVEL